MSARSLQRLRQRGLGLVEVLVAMTVGLALLGVIGYLFISTKRVNTNQTDVVRMQESARNATDMLGRAIRMAGYKLNVETSLADAPLGYTDGGAPTAAGALPPSDVLIIRHDPILIGTPTSANPLQGQEVNCEGVTVNSDNAPTAATGVSGPVNTQLVNYRFSVANGQLICDATLTNAVGSGTVIADNIENMQVTFGVGDGAESITQYTTTPVDPTKVSAIRISLLVRGPTTNQVVGGTQQVNFNGQNYTFNDGRLRQVVTSTFAVRNQARFEQ